jgi:hypothetical protein
MPLRDRRVLVFAALVSLILTLESCDTTSHNASSNSALAGLGTTTVSTTVAPPPSTNGATTTTVSATYVPPSTAAPADVPTLGHEGVFAGDSEGFGQVAPSEVFNGGDPTGLVTHIVWMSWGDSEATGTGSALWEAPNQPVAEGTEESATVVAFDLGTCGGKFMYQAVEWFFPQRGQNFDPNRYEDICLGTYVPS